MEYKDLTFEEFLKKLLSQWNMTPYYELVFRNAFESRESKCRAVLMKYSRKVKGEQVIALQMAQQLLMLYLDNCLVVAVKLNFC